MATYTAASGGGNWNATATWGGAGYPQAADTAIIASTSGTVTVNVTSACAVLTFQAAKMMNINANLTVSGACTFTGACTINGNYAVRVGGITLGSKGSVTGTATLELAGNQTVPAITFGCNVKFISGTITWGANTNSFSKAVTYVGGTMSFNAAHIMSPGNGCTISTSAITWQKVYFNTSSATVTLAADLNAVDVWFGQPNTLAGAYNINATNVRYGGTTTLTMTSSTAVGFVAGTTITASTKFELYGNYPYTCEMKSATPGTHFHIVYNGTAANCKIHNAKLTDVDASGGTSLKGAFLTKTNCTNVYGYRNSDVGGAGATICVN